LRCIFGGGGGGEEDSDGGEGQPVAASTSTFRFRLLAGRKGLCRAVLVFPASHVTCTVSRGCVGLRAACHSGGIVRVLRFLLSGAHVSLKDK